MHVSRVAVAVLCLASKRDSLVYVLDSDDSENRHHKFFLNKIMLEGNLGDGTTDVVAYLNSDLFENDLAVTTDTFTVDDLLCLAVLVGLLDENNFCKFICLCASELDASVFQHARDKSVRDVFEDEDLLFGDAGKVIIEGASVDNVLCGFIDVRRVIDDDGGIARACSDSLFARRKHGSDDSGTSRADEKLY